MTTANKITILRILLIPVFVVETLYYVKTGNEVHPDCCMYVWDGMKQLGSHPSSSPAKKAETCS